MRRRKEVVQAYAHLSLPNRDQEHNQGYQSPSVLTQRSISSYWCRDYPLWVSLGLDIYSYHSLLHKWRRKWLIWKGYLFLNATSCLVILIDPFPLSHTSPNVNVIWAQMHGDIYDSIPPNTNKEVSSLKVNACLESYSIMLDKAT